MSISPSEFNKGYSGLLTDQRSPIELNLATVEGAIKKVEESIRNVGEVKHEFNELHVKMADIAQSIFNASSINTLKRTEAEKIILSNAEANFEELKISKKELERELKYLTKEVQDYEAEMVADLKNLHETSQKVESFKNDNGSGFFHWLFGDSKIARERKSYTEAGNAKIKAEKAELHLEELTKVKFQINSHIQVLSTKQLELGVSLDARLRMARDVGQATKDAKKQHDDLIAKYEAKKELFYNDETAGKMTMDHQIKINDKLDSLIVEINKLEVLKDDISKKPIGNREEELEFMKASSENFKAIKKALVLSSDEVNILIRNSTSEKMSFSDKIGYAVSKLFAFKAKGTEDVLSKPEIDHLNKLYPGIDPYAAKMKYEESLKINVDVNPLKSAYESFKRKNQETIPETLDDDWDVNEGDVNESNVDPSQSVIYQDYVVPDIDKLPPLSPENGGPPVDLPPELPENEPRRFV